MKIQNQEITIPKGTKIIELVDFGKTCSYVTPNDTPAELVHRGMGWIYFKIMNRVCRASASILTTLFIFLACCGCGVSYAEINDQQAVRAIIGEAGNQGERGMLALACALRNRGTLKGVYGLRAKHVDKEPQWVWDMARRAGGGSAKNHNTSLTTKF